MRLVSFGVLAAAAACSSPETSEPLARTSAPIISGRPSGDDENAAVYIETKSVDGALLRCSGRIIAPGLVLSARHCILKRKSVDVLCSPSGEPLDASDTPDLRPEPAEQITVYVGSSKTALRAVAVREVLTTLEVTICRSDVAFLVLAEPGVEVRSPIRREPVRIGEKLSVSGWGHTSDARDALPTQRSTLDHVPVSEVGPGLIPDGTFSTGGNTLCFGDSGATALIDGAVVGTYSRIEGDAQLCSPEFTRNIFAATAAHLPLVERAYAAIGETPWYAGDRPPWLAAAGSPCTRDDECSSSICDSASSKCAASCGDAGIACPSGQQCSEASSTCVALDNDAGDALSPPASPSSCSAARDRTVPSAAPALLLAATCFALRRRARAGV